MTFKILDTNIHEKQLCKYIGDGLLHEFESNCRNGIYSAAQKLMAYNSNRIEGSTLTSEQAASLFDTGTLVSNGIEVYRAKNIEEMNGHFKMYNEMLKSLGQPLTTDIIKSYHYQLKNGVFEDMLNGYPVGEFKNMANRVSDIMTAKPEEVPDRINSLILEFENSRKELGILFFSCKL